MESNRGLWLSRVLVPATLLACLALALFLTKPAHVVNAQSGCTNATLDGSYGYFFQGYFLTHEGQAVGGGRPIGVSGIRTFDGNGNISGADTISDAGAITPRTYSGTYTVNSDCTGSSTLNFAGGGMSTQNLTIVESGKEIEFVNTLSGTVVAGSLKKQ